MRQKKGQKGFPEDRTRRAKAGPWKKSAHVKRTMTTKVVMRQGMKQESEARGILSGFEMSGSEKSEPFWAQQPMRSHWEEKM